MNSINNFPMRRWTVELSVKPAELERTQTYVGQDGKPTTSNERKPTALDKERDWPGLQKMANATGGNWTSLSGNNAGFGDQNVLNTTYTPSPADTAAGNVCLVLTTTGVGNCTPVSDTVCITITPSPPPKVLVSLNCQESTVKH